MYERLLPVADQYAMLGMTQMQWEGPVARVLGLLAGRLGRWDEAVAHLEDALARLRRLDARPLLARTAVRARPRAAAPWRRRRRAARARAARSKRAPSPRSWRCPGSCALVDAAARCVERGGDAARRRRRRRARAPSAAGRAPVTCPRGRVLDVRRARGETFRLKDSLGLQYLARLFAEPGREIHVLELWAGARAPAADAPVDGGDAGELLDDEARADYRRRLEDLRDTLAEAESFGDAARAAARRARRSTSSPPSSGGPWASAAGAPARARPPSAPAAPCSAASRTPSSASARPRRSSRPLLGRAVRTGNFCVYRP